MTTIKDPKVRNENTNAVAAAWLAFGFDTDRNLFYRQSRIPEVTELTWYLNCYTPFPMLANAHSFKEKSDRLADVNGGLFIYPVLMAADIIMYDADFVPVGKDQKQHLEITRDLANTFNKEFGETFVVPEPIIRKDVMVVPGTDGQKMSKSYNNIIDIFLYIRSIIFCIIFIQFNPLLLEPQNQVLYIQGFDFFALMLKPHYQQEPAKLVLVMGH